MRAGLLATKKAQRDKLEGDAVIELAETQDEIADRSSVFLEEAEDVAKIQDDDFAAQVGKVCELLKEHQIYEKMLEAAEQLGDIDYPATIQSQEEAMKVLLECLAILNRWPLNKARETTF